MFAPAVRRPTPIRIAAGLACAGLALACAGLACAGGQDAHGPRSSRELILAHDDNRATSSLTFPNLTYESIVRLELPPGPHRPLRLRVMAQAAGTVAIAFYENAVLECPGEEIRVITRELVDDDLSNGKDGRWAVEDLRELPELKGTIWLGVRKVAGAPAIWTSAVVSGQTYLRDRDPTSAMGLLPVKRTPMIRLELLP
ncbi:MAG: hypothetical protein ABUS79_02775 [Pseudomonadota bacterium]